MEGTGEGGVSRCIGVHAHASTDTSLPRSFKTGIASTVPSSPPARRRRRRPRGPGPPRQEEAGQGGGEVLLIGQSSFWWPWSCPCRLNWGPPPRAPWPPCSCGCVGGPAGRGGGVWVVFGVGNQRYQGGHEAISELCHSVLRTASTSVSPPCIHPPTHRHSLPPLVEKPRKPPASPRPQKPKHDFSGGPGRGVRAEQGQPQWPDACSRSSRSSSARRRPPSPAPPASPGIGHGRAQHAAPRAGLHAPPQLPILDE